MVREAAVILAVSTHADDAIFSAGEFIARQTAEGQEVTVLSICSMALPGDEAGVKWQDTLNMEHVRACASLGAFPAFGNFVDGKWKPLEDQRQLAGELVDRIVEYAPAIFLMPLGIHHPDHIEVAKACATATTKAGLYDAWCGTTYVYADLPYAAMYPEEAYIRRRLLMEQPYAMEDVANAGFLEQKLEACALYESQWGEDARRCVSVYERIWRI